MMDIKETEEGEGKSDFYYNISLFSSVEARWVKTSLLRWLQAQTHPDATPPGFRKFVITLT